MGRKKLYGSVSTVNIKFETSQWANVQEIAALESAVCARNITGAELVRQAVHYVFEDNERLREMFRRSRVCLKKRELVKPRFKNAL